MAKAAKAEKKKKKPILWVVLILIIAIIGFVVSTLFVSATTAAILYVESGTVQVDAGSGWQAAQDEMELKLDYKVKTSAGSSASIALYEGEIIRLSENTEVSISELTKESVKINQSSGSTWNKITKISGIKDYSVETPTTVATVRGTGFGVLIGGETNLLVGEGIVNFVYGSDQADVNAGEKAVTGNSIDKSALTAEDLAWIAGQKDKDIEILRKLRLREIYKKQMVVEAIKMAAKVDDEGIKQALTDIDEGKLNEKELIEKSPVQLPSIDKVMQLTQKIKELKGTA